jgi:hypothetical protein
LMSHSSGYEYFCLLGYLVKVNQLFRQNTIPPHLQSCWRTSLKQEARNTDWLSVNIWHYISENKTLISCIIHYSAVYIPNYFSPEEIANVNTK